MHLASSRDEIAQKGSGGLQTINSSRMLNKSTNIEPAHTQSGTLVTPVLDARRRSKNPLDDIDLPKTTIGGPEETISPSLSVWQIPSVVQVSGGDRQSGTLASANEQS